MSEEELQEQIIQQIEVLVEELGGTMCHLICLMQSNVHDKSASQLISYFRSQRKFLSSSTDVKEPCCSKFSL